ncbi:MAG TPA: DUF417 family protein [Polyangiaceae bacterium]|nr:DUF417 family protein [Polyangiaceae bacterium]
MVNSVSTPAASVSLSFAQSKAKQLERAGVAVLRYGLVFLLVMWGGFKFAAFEAEGIKPLISHSPLLSWLYSVTSVQGASNIIGVTEITTGLLMASRRWLPKLSGYASLAASGIFLTTLSFLVTTPGALEPSNPWGGFLMKDILLLGAALFSAGEALAASARP